jgi:hypothetical protein
MEKTAPAFYDVSRSAKAAREKFLALKSALKELNNIGNTIDESTYKSLDTEMKSFFALTDTGMYALIKDAKEFY